MEDAHHLDMDFGGQKWVYGGIYDGHGGERAARYAADHLHKRFLERITSGMQPVDAFVQSYDQISRDLENQDSGTAAVDFFIRGNDVFTANAGDSRAIVVSKTGFKQLSVDHRVDDSAERERVLQTGASISYPYVMRGAQGLMTTRSIGDRYFRPAGVISTPFTTHHAISNDDMLLISASDGLWDVMTSGEVCDMVREYPEPDDLLPALKDEVLNNRSGTDNLTIIAVTLPGA